VRWPSGVTKIRQRAVGGSPARGGANIVGENLAQLIGRNLANEAALGSQRSQPRQRVRRRSARNFLGRAHCVVKRTRAIGIDQHHPAPSHPELVDQRLAAGRHDIDNRVADSDDIVFGLGHENSLSNGTVCWRA